MKKSVVPIATPTERCLRLKCHWSACESKIGAARPGRCCKVRKSLREFLTRTKQRQKIRWCNFMLNWMTCSAFCALHWCFGIEGLRATAKILWDHQWDTSAVNAQWKLKPEETSPVRVSPSCRKSEPSRLEPVSVAVVMIGWRPFSLAALRC